MIVYSYKQVMQYGGEGDRIMAKAHDWSKPWYMNHHTPERAYFNEGFTAPRGKLNIDPVLRKWAARMVPPEMVMVQPHVKLKFSSTNRDWGWDRWQELAGRLTVPMVQCVPLGKPLGINLYQTIVLDGVTPVQTPTFEHACAILERVRGVVTSSGGFHIAAAAMNKPAVVIWGSYSDPAMLGYPEHVNLYEPDPDGLGQRKPHPACRAAMDRITVDQVFDAVTRTFP